MLWDKVKGDEEKLKIFANLGKNASVGEDLFSELNKVVCGFYGQKRSVSVNDARYNILWSNSKKGRIVDLSLLPPCESSLKLHV